VNPQAGLRLDRTVAECGDPVTGTVSWSGNRRGRPVAVVLRYRTQGRGDTDQAVVSRADLGAAESGQLRFHLGVPPAGPVSYHGAVLSLLWEVVVQIPAGRGEIAIAEVSVAPRGWSRLPAGPRGDG
jgi:hypothetical protein